MTYIGLIVALISIVHDEGVPQDFDKGIGFVTPPGGDKMHAIIYSNPDVTSDTVAILSGWEYIFHGDTGKVRASLVGFDKYDSWGLPILTILYDSSWARVSVEASDGQTRTQGWIDLRTPQTSVRIWADFLVTQSMVLNPDKPPQFYSMPRKNARLKVKLFRFQGFDEYSYILKPVRRNGRWLLVELQTPFLPCGSDDAVIGEPGMQPKTIRVWIEYLDKRGRPLVGPPMMC